MSFRYRDSEMAKRIIEKLGGMGLHHRFMHICGTHQDTLIRFGLEEMLRGVGVEVRQGPGCPVCVTTNIEIVEAMTLAQDGITLAVFGDMLRVPTPNGSLADARARGADVRIVYSIEDAIDLAMNGREVVFMAIGFETTVPTTAMPLLDGVPENFSVYSCQRVIPPALDAILGMGKISIDGFIQPGHVATIIGPEPFEVFSEKYAIPQVISGFEPLDMLMSIYMLAKQIREGRSGVENEYTRVVRPGGNVKALKAMEQVFRPVARAWRGFPEIPGSALELKDEFDGHNARLRYEDSLSSLSPVKDEITGCRCGDVLRGLIDSKECLLFGRACTPMSPMGPCMVSREGSCNITYRYHREI